MKRKEKKSSQKSLLVAVCANFNTFEERLDNNDPGIICMSFSEGEFFSPLTPETASKYTEIFWINILCNMRKKRFSQGKRGKNCTIFIHFFVLCENMYIFYEKEVVLRAYVYSSDFINRSQITGAHIRASERAYRRYGYVKKRRENCLRLQFFISQAELQ